MPTVSLSGVLCLVVALVTAGCESSTAPRPGLEYHLLSSSGHRGGDLVSGEVHFPSRDRIFQRRVFSTTTGEDEHETSGRYRMVGDTLQVSWVEPVTWVHWGVLRGDTLELQLIGAGDWPIRETYLRR